MSEYHDTNEDERDWPAYRATLRARGQEIGRECRSLDDGARARIRRVVANTTGSCQHILAGFDEAVKA